MAEEVVFRDEFAKELFQQALSVSFRNRLMGQRLFHLAVGYQAGVDADEVMERINAGELSR